MKSLIFKIKWMIKFRLKFLFQKEKNIGLVVNSFNKGGLEQMVLNLYYGYKSRGYNVYVLCAFNDAPLAKHLYDLRHIYIFNNNPENFAQFCYKKNINVLHYHYNTIMIRAARQFGFKILYTMHNVYTWFSKEELAEYKQRLDSARKVVCVSEYVKDYYTAKCGALNAVAIPNGLNFENLDKSYPDIPHTRESLGLAANTVTVATVASFYPVKHQIGMIGVMERLIQTNPNITLLLVGNIGSEEYYREFSAVLEKSPAKNNIIHIPYMENKYIGQLLRESVDIFCLATLQEGFGNATLEALYCKKPAVVTDTGCARDIIGFDSCKIVPCAYEDIKTVTSKEIEALSLKKENLNTEEIARAIKEIADNLPQYRQKAEITAEGLREFTLKAMIEKYISLI